MLPVVVNVPGDCANKTEANAPMQNRMPQPIDVLLLSVVHPDHWTTMLTGVPVIQAALTWMVASPFAVPEGTRKLT